MHYVYMIYSSSHDVYYKGYCSNYLRRLEQHNNGRSKYTKGKGPWQLVYIEQLENKSLALKREKQLKRQNRRYLEWLIKQDFNIVKEE